MAAGRALLVLALTVPPAPAPGGAARLPSPQVTATLRPRHVSNLNPIHDIIDTYT